MQVTIEDRTTKNGKHIAWAVVVDGKDNSYWTAKRNAERRARTLRQLEARQ